MCVHTCACMCVITKNLVGEVGGGGGGVVVMKPVC